MTTQSPDPQAHSGDPCATGLLPGAKNALQPVSDAARGILALDCLPHFAQISRLAGFCRSAEGSFVLSPRWRADLLAHAERAEASLRCLIKLVNNPLP